MTLTDNGSKFGSFVDGRRLSANQKVELSIGSELKFGQGPTTGTFKQVPMHNATHVHMKISYHKITDIWGSPLNLEILSQICFTVECAHFYACIPAYCSIAASYYYVFVNLGWCMSHSYSAAPVWVGRKSRESSSWQRRYVMHY